MRDDLYWSQIERERGVLELPAKLEPLRTALEAVHARGGRPLLILSFGNRHYDNGGLVQSDEAIAAFCRYARFIIRTFGHLTSQYEVWNEWNSGFGSNPKQSHGDAAAYARLLRSVHAAIKAEQPGATVVGGATAGIDLRWIGQFADAGGLDHLDALSVHSYTLFRYRDNPEGAIRGLDELDRRLRTARPGRATPILITEMGWPTNQGRFGVGEVQAAANLTRFMLLARSRPFIRGVWWYDLIDDGDGDRSMEHRFGLVRRDGTPKPAYRAAQRIAPWMASGRVEASRLPPDGHVVQVHHKGQNWLVAWRVPAEVASWPDGQPDGPLASPSVQAATGGLPADGVPVFYQRAGAGWQRV